MHLKCAVRHEFSQQHSGGVLGAAGGNFMGLSLEQLGLTLL